MLPDFRFILGAVLALMMLAVGGLGLLTSVHLVREAQLAPVEESRSLAFAGHPEWNQFYDPEAARRFERLARKAPVAEARLEPPAETSALAPPEAAPPTITPADPEERTAASPSHRPEVAPEIVPLNADDPPPEKELDPPTPLAIAAPLAETRAPDGERVASLPAPLPGPGALDETQPQAADAQPQDSAPPTPRARPRFHAHAHRRFARARIRRIPPVAQQPPDNLGFPPSNALSPWPGYDNQFTGATTKKNAGKLTGR